MIYVFTTMLSAMIASIINYSKLSTEAKKIGYFISFIPLFLIGALRAYVGIDYTTYSLYQIPDVLGGSLTVKFEPLDKLVVYLGYYLANQQHYFYIFSIFHIILMWYLYKYIVQQSSNVTLSLFLLLTTVFFTFSLSGIRQSIATAVVFFALKYINEKKYITFVFYVIIACLFHASAIVYITFLVLGKIKINKYIGITISILALSLSLSGSELVSQMMLTFNFYSEYVGSRFFTGSYDQLHQLFTILMCLLIFSFYFFISEKNWNELNIYININFVLLLVAILMPLLPTPSRNIYMYVPVQIVLIPKLITAVKDYRVKAIVTALFVFAYSIFFVFMVLNRNAYQTLPYQTIFEYLR